MEIEAAPGPAFRACSAASQVPASPTPPPAASPPQCPSTPAASLPHRRAPRSGSLELPDPRPEHQPHERGRRLHYELQLCCFSTRHPARDSTAIACSGSEKCFESWICFTRKITKRGRKMSTLQQRLDGGEVIVLDGA